MRLDRHSNPFWNRTWVKVAAWTFAFVVSYFVLYPMFLIFLFDGEYLDGTLPEPLGDAIDLFIDYSVIPLNWLADHSTSYEGFIDWVDSLFPD